MDTRKIIAIAGVGSILLLPVISYVAWHSEIRAAKLKNFAVQIIKRDAGIPPKGQMSDRQEAERIRDFVYRNFKPGKQPRRSGMSFYASLASSENTMVCDGAADAYQWALKMAEIPARGVDLAGQKFLNGQDAYQTHATVEVYLDGKWEISDPTFNVSIGCSGDTGNISVPEASACISSGRSLTYRSGKTQIAGRTVATYYEPFPAFFAAWRRKGVSFFTASSEDEYPNHHWLQESLKKYSANR